MRKTFVILVAIFVSACTTTQSVGTSGFVAAWSACSSSSDAKFADCMYKNPNSRQYTPAEREMVAYISMVFEKHRRGQLTRSEAQYYITAYVRNAKEISNQAEAAQAAAIGSALGAAAGTAAYVADRKCRAAGTC